MALVALWAMVIYTVRTFWITSWRCGPGFCVAATGCRGCVGRAPGWAPSRAPAIRLALNMRAMLVPDNAPLMLCSRISQGKTGPHRRRLGQEAAPHHHSCPGQ